MCHSARCRQGPKWNCDRYADPLLARVMAYMHERLDRRLQLQTTAVDRGISRYKHLGAEHCQVQLALRASTILLKSWPGLCEFKQI